MICTAPCNPTFAHRRHFYKTLYEIIWKSPHTRRRTDHFAADVTYLQFLVQVYFSSTLTSQPGLPDFTVAFRRKSNTFVLCPWTFDLWLWSTNLTQIGSRWTTTPNADMKVHSVGKLSSKHANTHTCTQLIDCSTRPENGRKTCRLSNMNIFIHHIVIIQMKHKNTYKRKKSIHDEVWPLKYYT